jgi:hypothetical protein
VYSMWWFPLLCRSLLVSCSVICQSFLLIDDLLESYLESYCLRLYVSVLSIFFLQYFQCFRPFIKILTHF